MGIDIDVYGEIVMDMNEYQDRTAATAVYNPEKEIEYLTAGLSSEVGEVAGVIKRIWRDNPDAEVTRENVKKELGDVLWYVAQLAGAFDLGLSEIATDNLDKLMDRHLRGKIIGNGDNR